MSYDIDKKGTILGATDPLNQTSDAAQSAIVMVKDEAGGSRVFLGCSSVVLEGDGFYQMVAALGNELPFEYIEYLYKTLKKQKAAEQRRAYYKKYYSEHRKEIRERSKGYEESKKYPRSEYQKKWVAKNREKWNAYMREYQRKKREEAKLVDDSSDV